MTNKRFQSMRGGAATLMSFGAVVLGLSASVLAIDLPFYFDSRNQLQTTVDAAALAGAAQLPVGEQEAEAAALEYALKNPVAGKTLSADNVNFIASHSKFTVTGKVEVPTIMGKVICALAGKTNGRDTNNEESGNANPEEPGTPAVSTESSSCSAMTVVASSSAAPAARDTILVIDTSSSMDDLGYGRPMVYIQDAANSFIDIIADLNNESVDRIGLVSFNQSGRSEIGLTSQNDSSQFAAVKSRVNDLRLFSGYGWNTNYEPGLRLALDELEQNGRANAEKTIIFMTDGMPNTPAPPSYHYYNNRYPYKKCTDIVNYSTAVRNLCYYSWGRWYCPVVPSSRITPQMIPESAVSCGQDYVDYMLQQTNFQTDRAKRMKVKVHTIALRDTDRDSYSQETLRQLIKDPDWVPGQLAYMTETTDGERYEAENYEAARIREIYETIAKDIHIRLTQ